MKWRLAGFDRGRDEYCTWFGGFGESGAKKDGKNEEIGGVEEFIRIYLRYFPLDRRR
jgi:hypothetical protein